MPKSEKGYEAFKSRMVSVCQIIFDPMQLANAFKDYELNGAIRPSLPQFMIGGCFFPLLDDTLEAVLRWAYYGDEDALAAIYEWYREKDEQQRRRQQPPGTTNKARKKTACVGYIYLVKAGEHYKIGKSLKPAKRVAYHMASSPYPLECHLQVKVADYTRVELDLHALFAPKCVKPEWFKLDEYDIQAVTEYLRQREVA